MEKKSKIMLSLVTPLIERLNGQMEQIGVRRDSYLTRLLDNELDLLDASLEGKRNCDAGKAYLRSELQKLPRTSVSITLSKSVIEKLGSVCEKHNIDRDCLINRVIFFLSAERKHLKTMGIECSDTCAIELMEDSINPFTQAHLLISNPFARIRQWMDESADEPIPFYLWEIGLPGLNCIIEDHLIPGTEQYEDFLNIA